jgi:exopolysaccharide production protein ExoZ
VIHAFILRPGREKPAGRASYLPNVQILRFVAALMVLFAHLIHETRDHRVPLMLPIADRIGIEWGTGVDVFFIVSGFVMYYLTSEQFGARGYAKEFLKRRVVRVVPLYWLFTALMLLALWQVPARIRHADAPLSTVIASFLFFPVTRAGGLVQPILGLGWTLEYEMFFYGCFALALLQRRSTGLAALAASFLCLVVVGRFLPDSMTSLKFWSNSMIVEFLLGIWLAHLYLSGLRLSLRVQFALLIASFGLMVITSHLPSLDRLIAGGIPALVLVFGMALGPEWNVRWLALGGDSSFSLYLSHPFTLNMLAIVWTKTHVPPNGPAYVVVGMMLCVAVALGVYRFVETPMLRLLRRQSQPFPQRVLLDSSG